MSGPVNPYGGQGNSWGKNQRRLDEIQWVLDNPDFRYKPATMEEFLGPGYLDLDIDQNPLINPKVKIRPGVKQGLIEIFGTDINPRRISKVRRAMMTGGIGVGKGHTPDTPILTPRGWVCLDSVSVGDQVVGSDGLPTEVTGFFPRGELDAYRVSFNDGASVIVDGDHLWNVRTPNGKMRNAPWSTISTTELMELGIVNARGQKKFHIPVVEPVEFDAVHDLKIPPYLLGALLGDGGLTQSTPIISSVDQEILDRVASESVRLKLSHKSRCDYAIVAGGRGGRIEDRRNWLADALRWYGLMGHGSHEKFIPMEYLVASVDDRIDLLRGIMDTDGYILEHGSVQVSTSSSALADGVVELVRSLGGIARRTIKSTSGRDAHVLTLNVTFNPFHLSRKASKWKAFDKYRPARMISAIEPVGKREIICISVKAEDQLYVTKDYIVTHNTTFASIALAYMVHWVECLKDPQSYFGLFPGSRIAFMLMSTKGSQTNEVLFSDIKARIANSEWFQKNAQYNLDDRKRVNQLRFPRDIWIIPGNSSERTFEGYNILGGILDEGDSHKVTDTKDYAEEGWDTIENRISSRFTDLHTGDHMGLIIAIGQMKMADGFMARKKKEMEDQIDGARKKGEEPKAHVVTMTIWESHGWEAYRDPKTGKIPVFWYDINRRQIVPAGPAKMLKSKTIIRIPEAYKHLFERDPVKALKDQAGIPPQVEDPFIAMTDRVDEAMDKYEARCREHPEEGFVPHPVVGSATNPTFHDDLMAPDRQKRVLHVDIGYAAHGDALGMAMGHVHETVDIDGEWKPYIVIDMLLRMIPRGGEDLMLKEFRDRIVELRDERKYNISVVTFDGFQSIDSQQILRKQHRFNVGEVSVDRSKGPYEDLRECINERRIEFPRHMTLLHRTDPDKVCVVRKELLELTDVGRKIDHPPRGSKDIADAMAAVVHTLMSNHGYRRGAKKRVDADVPDLSQYAAPGRTNRSVYDGNFSGGEKTDLDELLNPLVVGTGRGTGPKGLPPIERYPFGEFGKPRMS